MIERERKHVTCKQLNIKICDANIYHHTLLTRNVWNDHYVAKIGDIFFYVQFRYKISAMSLNVVQNNRRCETVCIAIMFTI